MQKFAALSALALVALGVSAQSSVCPDVAITTVTGTVTETYCPDCGLTTPLPLPTGSSGTTIINDIDVEINIYVFPSIGPNGWSDVTYTVTEACPCTAKPSGYIPEGFTTTVTTCDVGGTTTTATMTCPEASMTEEAGASTTWTTVWQSPCATGMADVTYTITEECPCEATHAADYVPSGFTTTVVTDTAGATPAVQTVTVPCESETGSGSGSGTGAATMVWSSTVGGSTPVAVVNGSTVSTAQLGGSSVSTAQAGGSSVSTAQAGGSSVSTAQVGGSTASSTSIATWTGAAASHTSNMGIALFTVAALTLAAAIGF